MIHPDLRKEPVSTANPAFLAALRTAFDQGSILILLRRLNRAGGAQDAYQVTSMAEVESLLNRSGPGDSISVFFPSMFPLRGKAGPQLAAAAARYLESQGELKEWGAAVLLGKGLSGGAFSYVCSADEIRAWFEEHPGAEMAIGSMNFCKDNCEEVLTAYIPGPDGVVRTGAY